MTFLPLGNGRAECVIRNQGLVGQGHVRHGTGAVLLQPALDSPSLKGEPIRCNHWVQHHVLQNSTHISVPADVADASGSWQERQAEPAGWLGIRSSCGQMYNLPCMMMMMTMMMPLMMMGT